ncbi:MAG: hypothetical protein EOP20_11120 [Hyphomicrobiales bacterium]|nr:MAG: hypothetical protein EOP20_11120 [Hyphomicrobiales bacterium]
MELPSPFFFAQIALLAGHNWQPQLPKRPVFPLFTGTNARFPGFSASSLEPLPHGHSKQSGFPIPNDLGYPGVNSAIPEIQFLRIDQVDRDS